jgi:hypothetical protein
MFVMLNPSTADAITDDPTIRRCIGFARAWGYDGLMVGNIFAYRSTDPKALRGVPDPVGPENVEHLIGMAASASVIVCAWGDCKVFTPSMIQGLALEISDHGKRPLQCLGQTKGGYPRHPLYIPKTAKPQAFQPAT